MALTLPELKHEYIFQLDTEETKNSVFDLCREEAKEAAYSTFGTNPNDAEYLPSPVKDPDYMMDYCTSDGHDYLKDYKLIWGYGIGIIEQDVICSLSTGEHLAEGIEACDTYETENISGKDIEWKRGKWLKFSGNRNVSPTRIGEVVLPDYIISLKDLCAALKITDECNFEWFDNDSESILNIDNLCGQQSISIIADGSTKTFSSNIKTAAYAFANADVKIEHPYQFFLNADCIDYNHCFYNANIVPDGNIYIEIYDENVNVESMYEECTLIGDYSFRLPSYVGKTMFKNLKGAFELRKVNCQSNVESCFEGCTLYDTGSRDLINPENDELINYSFPNFSKVTNAKRMFYNTNWVYDEAFLDLSSIAEHEDGCFNNFFNTDNENKTFNIKAPNIKIKGSFVFGDTTSKVSSNADCTLYNNTFNIINILYYYNHIDNLNCQYDLEGTYLFAIKESTVNGVINGCNIFILPNSRNLYSFTVLKNSNLKIVTPEYTEEELKQIVNNPENIPYIAYFNTANISNHNYVNNFVKLLNLDDYYFVNQIACTTSNYTDCVNDTINIDKRNKTFCIVNNNATPCIFNITTNNNTNIYLTNSCNNVVYNDGNSDRQKYNKIILDNEEFNNNYNIIKYIIPYDVNLKGSYEEPFNIEASQYDVEVLNEITTAATVYKVVYKMNFNSIHNIILLDFFNQYNTSHTTHIIAKDFNKLIFKPSVEDGILFSMNNLVYSDNSLYFYTHVDTGVIETYLSTGKKYVCPGIRYINLNENSNFPSITSPNGELGGYCMWAIVDNINLEEALKYIEDFTFEVECCYGIRIDGIKNLISAGDEINITYTPTKPFNEYLIIHCENIPVNIIIEENGTLQNNSNKIINVDAHGYYKDENLYLKSFILNDDFSNTSYGEKNTITFSNLCKDCSIKFNSSIKIIEFNSMSNLTELIIDGNKYDYIYAFNTDNTFVNLTKLVINNIALRCDLNLRESDKLTQESINSIVNPTNFISGCTLTINTIPFKFITDEQKQALVSAGVTLVEYISTETTE